MATELEVECDRNDALAEMLAKLNDKTQLSRWTPETFQGHLREYQKRGRFLAAIFGKAWASMAAWRMTWAWAKPCR
jgi:nicotinate-nucleotide pyrophosphorylase